MNSTCSFPLIIRRRLATLRRIRPASCVWGVTWGCPLPLTTHRRPVCFNEFPARSPLSYFRIGVKRSPKIVDSITEHQHPRGWHDAIRNPEHDATPVGIKSLFDRVHGKRLGLGIAPRRKVALQRISVRSCPLKLQPDIQE